MKNEKKKLLIYIAGGCGALALGLGIVAYRHPHVAAANGAVVSAAGNDMERAAADISDSDNTATETTVSGNAAAAFSTQALEGGMTLADLPALTIASGVSFAEVQDPEAISFAVAPDEEESEYANLQNPLLQLR